MTIELTLEDRIYCLNRTPAINKQPELFLALVMMDSFFIRGDDQNALSMVEHIEQTCHERGIDIHIPENAKVKEVALIG